MRRVGSEHLIAADFYTRCKKVSRLPPVSLIKRTFELLDSYEGTELDNNAVLILALRFGLRRNEIFQARRDWIEFAGRGGPHSGFHGGQILGQER